MRTLFKGLLVVPFLISPAWADEPAEEKAGTPKERLEALMNELSEKTAEYQDLSRKIREEATAGAETPEERRKALREAQSRMPSMDFRAEYAKKIQAIAEENPGKPVAGEAWSFVFMSSMRGPQADKAMEALTRDHAKSDSIGGMMTILGMMYNPKSEDFLRKVAAENPHREIKGKATLALAQSFRSQVEMKERIEKGGARNMMMVNAMLGQDGIEKVKNADVGELNAEAEKLFDIVIAEYADVKNILEVQGQKIDRGTLGKTAESNLFEMRNLLVGKPAPDIVGEDTDGVEFKLSDYRGKVVFLDFWGHW